MRKTALITGATGGLGIEFADLFAQKGCDLILVGRSEEKLVRLQEVLHMEYDVGTHLFLQDLAKPDAALSIRQFTEERGIRVQYLVNNAGFGDSAPFAESDWARQQEMVQVNILALMQLTHCYLPEMLSRNSGRILNIASIASFLPGPEMSVYYASKAFVRSFSEALHEETRGSKVTVTALCPGPVDTGFEKAAGLEKSPMFHMMRPADAQQIAREGFLAMMRGETVHTCGIGGKLVKGASRLMPDILSARGARWINHSGS